MCTEDLVYCRCSYIVPILNSQEQSVWLFQELDEWANLKLGVFVKRNEVVDQVFGRTPNMYGNIHWTTTLRFLLLSLWLAIICLTPMSSVIFAASFHRTVMCYLSISAGPMSLSPVSSRASHAVTTSTVSCVKYSFAQALTFLPIHLS